jgi:opacity protein-like surface antigen
MKSLTKIIFGLSSLMIANTAMADWYASGSIAYNNVEDQESTGTNRLLDIDYDSDVSFAGALGYSFPSYGIGNFRTEIEFSSRENDVDELSFNNVARNATGDISAYSVLFNGYYDFTNVHDKFVPYVGFGLGFTSVDADIQYGPADFNGDDTVFSFQGIAGVTYKATENLDLFTDFRYIVADDPELNRFGGPAPVGNVELDSEYDAYTINFGVRYNF